MQVQVAVCPKCLRVWYVPDQATHPDLHIRKGVCCDCSFGQAVRYVALLFRDLDLTDKRRVPQDVIDRLCAMVREIVGPDRRIAYGYEPEYSDAQYPDVLIVCWEEEEFSEASWARCVAVKEARVEQDFEPEWASIVVMAQHGIEHVLEKGYTLYEP